MVTLVLAEEVEEEVRESAISQVEVGHWYYYVPCAGVRYYIYKREPGTGNEIDPWALDGLTARD